MRLRERKLERKKNKYRYTILATFINDLSTTKGIYLFYDHQEGKYLCGLDNPILYEYLIIKNIYKLFLRKFKRTFLNTIYRLDFNQGLFSNKKFSKIDFENCGKYLILDPLDSLKEISYLEDDLIESYTSLISKNPKFGCLKPLLFGCGFDDQIPNERITLNYLKYFENKKIVKNNMRNQSRYLIFDGVDNLGLINEEEITKFAKNYILNNNNKNSFFKFDNIIMESRSV